MESLIEPGIYWRSGVIHLWMVVRAGTEGDRFVEVDLVRRDTGSAIGRERAPTGELRPALCLSRTERRRILGEPVR